MPSGLFVINENQSIYEFCVPSVWQKIKLCHCYVLRVTAHWVYERCHLQISVLSCLW